MKDLLVALVLFSFYRESKVYSFSPARSVLWRYPSTLYGWVEGSDGEWEWQEDDPNYEPTTTVVTQEASATPTLPSGKFRPKQSLGQNFLKDGNTVAKILRAFDQDISSRNQTIVELGPGAGALTDQLVAKYGTDVLECIEVDSRSVELLQEKHALLKIHHEDVLQVDYPQMALQAEHPLVVIGNLPYYITSQILFCLADASHVGAVDCATVTMQWEVARRMVAPTRCKDYGILSVVFQLYADVNLHFKIPPTVFYPQPKVDSALVGLHFLGPTRLRQRLAGVEPKHLRRVVTTAFRQRRKTIRNSLKKLAKELYGEEFKEMWSLSPPPLPSCALEARENGDAFAQTQQLCKDWASKRPEELSPGQFVELTRLLFGPKDGVVDSTVPLGTKVWRKLKHGEND